VLEGVEHAVVGCAGVLERPRSLHRRARGVNIGYMDPSEALLNAERQVELSVVVAVYKCAGCLRALHERLTASLDWLAGRYELVFIEDHGADQSWEVLRELASVDPAVRAYRLSRNFGQHAAITAGLSMARGRWVVVMDCDLQDPPETIPFLYAKAQEGYDIVYACRRSRHTPLSRRLTARAYFALLNRFTGAALEPSHGTFSIISRKVVAAYLRFQDRDRHYLLVLNWLGFESTAIEYDHAVRYAGKSSYGLTSLIRHAFDGVFFQTTVLLRWIVYLGFLVAFSGIGLAVYFSIRRLTGTASPGWTSLIAVILVIGGFIIVCTGVTGLYIGKIFEQVKGRPLFVIDQQAVGGSESRVGKGEGIGRAAKTR
jgi:polyisoprenyl-phosphate glycosyltransferase